jgi:adapter protein MecA 1/2
MDYSYVNDRTLRISLTFADLEAHDVQLVDFLSEQEKVEDFFYELIDELDISERWADTNLMTFQIRPNAKGIDILVSDDFSDSLMQNGEMASDLEEFLRHVAGNTGLNFPDTNFFDGLEAFDEDEVEFAPKSRTARNKNIKNEEPEPDFVYYTIKFNNFADIINLAKTVKPTIDESELYEYKDNYYLTILDNQKLRGKKQTMNVRARMLEYGEQGMINRELLREHARVIIDHGALQNLQKI